MKACHEPGPRPTFSGAANEPKKRIPMRTRPPPPATVTGSGAVAPVAAGPRHLQQAVVHGTTIVITAASLVWLVRLLTEHDPLQGPWIFQLLLALGTLLAGGWGAIQRHWYCNVPVRRLLDLARRVQAGELPIESLSRVKGGVAPLVPLVQDLLGDIRRQRSELAAVEKDLGQRVASRTDALERALGSLKQQAVRDALTGLYNRRMLDEHLPPLVERRRADGGPLSVLMADVDHFKMLNDTLGHAAGDELLRSIGQLIRSGIRDGDLAFRFGGDEFVVLLDGCDAPAARKLADRLISLVDALTKPMRVPRPPRLSVGVGRLADLADPSPHALLRQADRALYEEKRSRKRVA